MSSTTRNRAKRARQRVRRAALPKHRPNGPYYPVGDVGGERCVTCRTPWPCDLAVNPAPAEEWEVVR